MIQFALAFFGLSAIFMAMGHNLTARKWAPIVGLCGQPFWLTFAYQTHASGVMLLSLAYTVVYLIGVRNQWMSKITINPETMTPEEVEKAIHG